MTRLAALCVVLCVVLAGCGGGASPTGTASDAGTTTGSPEATDAATDTPTPTVAPGDYLANKDLPAGMSADGLTNKSALVEAHQAIVESEGAEVEVSTRIVSGGQETTSNLTGRYAADGSYVVERVGQSARGESSIKAYFDGSTTFVEQSSTRTIYSKVSGSDYADQFRAGNALDSYLSLANFTLDSVDTEDETVRFVATGPGNSSLSSGDSEVSNVSGELVVGLDGTIQHVAVGLQVTQRGRTSTLNVSYTLTARGVDSVDEPAWVSTAREQATDADLSIEVVDDTVRITHEGGDDVPAGAQIFVQTTREDGDPGRTFLANLNESLSEGETVTVYLEDARSFEGTVERGAVSPDSAVSLNGTALVRITFQGEVITHVEFEIGSNDGN